MDELNAHQFWGIMLLDGHLTAKERAETFLELHGNVMLRQKTADYLVTRSKWLEDAVAQLSMQPAAAAATRQQEQHDSDLGVLSAFDLSLLLYQDRDALLETFQRFRQKASYNMAAAWDGRLRKWYGDRYDFRTNLIDWDYHMRLSPRGTPFMDPALGSIVHFYHFRHWRLTGVAHELRESSYVAANTSLLSTAYGRTKEFKDRQLHDVGRSVSAFGYWGDVLNSPLHAFGTVADDPLLFKVANKQFTHTALDVAEHNVMQIIKTLQRKGSEDAQEAMVGHRHVHMLGENYAVKSVMQPGAPVLVETGHNMVQLNAEQVAAFGDKVLEAPIHRRANMNSVKTCAVKYKGLAVQAPQQEFKLWEYDQGPLGPTEVEINVTHNGLCHTDLHMKDDDWGLTAYPLIPGHEVVGTVKNVGSDVQGLKEGDRVGVGWIRNSCRRCKHCLRGNENLCVKGYTGLIVGGRW
eukprot:gene4584-4838_t